MCCDIDLIKNEIAANYKIESYPCLYDQFNRFDAHKPFKGLRILHAIPLFRNVLPKLMPLLVSGAELVVSVPNMPYDRVVGELLLTAKIDFKEKVDPGCENNDFDVVLDCVGTYSHFKGKYGNIELTKSGEYYYEKCDYPWISVDKSIIKTIEDSFGTGDGLIRAFKKSGISLKDKKIVVFGFGKVGRGVFYQLKNHTKNIVVVERDENKVLPSDNGHATICYDGDATINTLVKNADIIITATGVNNVIENHYSVENFKNNQLLVNVGAEDEFGPSFAETEVFNNKAPANFILQEPTRLKYLDATFALHNESIASLINYTPETGTCPSSDHESYFLDIMRKNGLDDLVAVASTGWVDPFV